MKSVLGVRDFVTGECGATLCAKYKSESGSIRATTIICNVRGNARMFYVYGTTDAVSRTVVLR